MCNIWSASNCFPLMDPAMIPRCDTSTARNGHEPCDARAGQPSSRGMKRKMGCTQHSLTDHTQQAHNAYPYRTLSTGWERMGCARHTYPSLATIGGVPTRPWDLNTSHSGWREGVGGKPLLLFHSDLPFTKVCSFSLCTQLNLPV